MIRLHLQGQACHGAFKGTVLPCGLFMGSPDHIAPSKTSPALLKGLETEGRGAFFDDTGADH